MDTGDSSIKEIGIGGALMLSLLIIKEVVTGLLKRNGKKSEDANSAGERPVAEWEQRIERVVERVMENKIEPKIVAMRSALDDIKQAVMTIIRWKGGGD